MRAREDGGRSPSGALGIAVKAPGRVLARDAPPDGTFFGGAHRSPALHFFESATTTFAARIALAGGANGDAGRVGRACVPGLPRGQGLRCQRLFVDFLFMAEHHARIHLGQRARGRREHAAAVSGGLRAPVIDCSLDVGDVDGGHGHEVGFVRRRQKSPERAGLRWPFLRPDPCHGSRCRKAP